MLLLYLGLNRQVRTSEKTKETIAEVNIVLALVLLINSILHTSIEETCA